MSEGLLDSLWVIFASILVFFMHAGFALVETGFCRRKNAVVVLLKNVGVVSIASLIFYTLGYGFMFGEGNAFIGLSGFAPDGTEADVGTLPVLVFAFFQLVFAATACTIVSGAVAERARLVPFFIFCAISTAIVYPTIGHWVWGGGWLSTMGFRDFAGSTVVHAVGGGMALAAAMVVGPRIGRFGKRAKPMPAHNFPLAALGVLILWLGWFGFNGGSTVSAQEPAAIASIILVTNLAASSGFLVALGYTKLRTGALDFSMALNGALAGLVGITAGCDIIGSGFSILTGAIAAILCTESVFLLERLEIDDPVGAISVHGTCGAFGTIAVGLFGKEVGLFVGGGATQLGIQTLGVGAALLGSFAASFVIWRGLKMFGEGVRVDAEHELEGLDVSECGVSAYGNDVPHHSGFAHAR